MLQKDRYVCVKIHGFCNGYFGRDSYSNKIIIASGENWIVAKAAEGQNEFASFANGEEMHELIVRWNTEGDDDE
jgi:hypothetical protein